MYVCMYVCMFLESNQPCELNSLDVALDVAGVEKVSSENLQLQSTLAVDSVRDTLELRYSWFIN